MKKNSETSTQKLAKLNEHYQTSLHTISQWEKHNQESMRTISKWKEIYQESLRTISKWEAIHQEYLKTISKWEEQHQDSLKTINYLQEMVHVLRKQSDSNLTNIDQEIIFKRMQILEAESITSKKEIQLQNSIIEFQNKTIEFLLHDQTSPKQEPLFSIILPTFNRSELIGAAIESVISQTYQNWELIIVDGSTDETKNSIALYLTDKRIHYFFQPQQGVSAARNLGLSKSKGEWIGYLDSDNKWFPNVLDFVRYYLTRSTMQAIYFAAIWEDHLHNKKWIYFPTNLTYDKVILEHQEESITGIDINVFMHHRSLYEKFGGFDTSLTILEDYEFVYRYFKKTQIKPLPFIGTYYNYCLAANSLSTNSIGELVQQALKKIRKKYQNLNTYLPEGFLE